MNGVKAIVSLLTGNAALTVIVPAARIMAGVLPHGAPFPQCSVMRVSATDLNIPAPADKRMVRELVQVTVLAANYPQQHQVLGLVKKAAADRLNPTVGGISGVTVHTAGAGPDFMDETASIYIGTQDFTVIYSEDR